MSLQFGPSSVCPWPSSTLLEKGSATCLCAARIVSNRLKPGLSAGSSKRAAGSRSCTAATCSSSSRISMSLDREQQLCQVSPKRQLEPCINLQQPSKRQAAEQQQQPPAASCPTRATGSTRPALVTPVVGAAAEQAPLMASRTRAWQQRRWQQQGRWRWRQQQRRWQQSNRSWP